MELSKKKCARDPTTDFNQNGSEDENLGQTSQSQTGGMSTHTEQEVLKVFGLTTPLLVDEVGATPSSSGCHGNM